MFTSKLSWNLKKMTKILRPDVCCPLARLLESCGDYFNVKGARVHSLSMTYQLTDFHQGLEVSI